MGEIRSKVMQKATETQEESYKSGAVQYIDSREVAEIVEKQHKNLLADINKYVKELTKLNFQLSDFFIESSYNVEGQSRKYPCYLVTRKGCEFIAHKLTGEKGTKFTATYINRFHQMEDRLSEKEYEKQLDVIFNCMEKRFQYLTERQDKFEQMVLTKLNCMEYQKEDIKVQECIKFPTIEEDADGLTRRRRELNRLINKLVKVSGWDKNFALHRLYKTLEEVLGIYLDDYLDIYREETCKSYASTMEVVAAYDNLYETSVKLCENTIRNMD